MDNQVIDKYEYETKESTEVVANCYKELSKYVARTRAYASATDGLKAVYRRVLYASKDYTKLVKSAVIVGESLKYHAHGDSSSYSTLVTMACKYGKFPLYVTKGNFGGLGQGAAAMRYTECHISELAKLMFFELIDYADFIDGEAGMREPKYLPALLPYSLIVGAGGISVGLPNATLPPLNYIQLVDYYIDMLEGKSELVLPIVDEGGIFIDCDKTFTDGILNNGYGKLWYAPNIIQESNDTLVITDETPNCSFYKLYKKLSTWIDNEWISYIDESDGSGSRHVFTIENSKKVTLDDLKYKINKVMYSTNSYKYIVEDDDKAVYCNFDFIVDKNITYLRKCARRKYEDLLNKAKYKHQVLLAIEHLKSSGKLPEIGKLTSAELVDILIEGGFTKEVSTSAINRPISYLTKSHKNEIDELVANISEYTKLSENPDSYLLSLYYKLRDILKDMYSRKNHSIFYKDANQLGYAKLSEDKSSIEVTSEELGTTWNNSLLLIHNSGFIENMIIPTKIPNSYSISPGVGGIVPDRGKYLIIIIGDKYLKVLETKDLYKYSDYRFKSWDGYDVRLVYTTDNPIVKIVYGIDDDEFEIDVRDYIKSRISYPSKISKVRIKEVLVE